MKDAETQIRGELFTHRLLWECCNELAETAHKARGSGADPFYFELSSMLMAFLTYESYINFLGDRLGPEIWKREKEYFNKNPYKGLEGKLKKVHEMCDISNIQKHKRPYQTIKDLSSLRTYLSHGKPDKYEKVVKHERGKDPGMFYAKINQMVSEKHLNAAIHDVEEFIEFLHKKARRVGDEVSLDEKALEGVLQESMSDTRSI